MAELKDAIKINEKKIHELKILPEYYDAVRFGDKRFEIRKNDRGFQRGDILRLKEWDGEKYTGEELDALVRYVLYDWTGGLQDGYCIMSIDTMMHVVPKHEKEGHWIVLEYCANEGIYCSECHMKIFDRTTKPKYKLSKYCPHCGSRNEQFFRDGKVVFR